MNPPPAAAARLDSAPLPLPERKPAAPKAPARADRPFKGIALILASTVFLGLSDVTAKYLASSLHSIEITWIRFMVFALIMMPAMIPVSPLYALTTRRRKLHLMRGATVLDFAYHVHTDLGHRCRGAKVDGQMVPLDYKLKNAQRVEITSAKQGGPSRDWLSPQLGYLASPRALAKVRQWFRHEDHEKDAQAGRTVLEKELQRLGATQASHERVATAAGFEKLEDFFAALGRGEVTSRQVEIAVRGEAPAPQQPVGPQVVPVTQKSSSSGVLVLGVNNLATMIAKCCKPVPPDPIVGFITRARGVMVHRQDCVNITGLAADQRDRLMAADWGRTGEEAAFSAELEVVALDRQGLLRDISEAISRERINVTAVNTLSRGTHAFMRFTLQVSSADGIQRVLRQVKDVPGVDSARRL